MFTAHEAASILKLSKDTLRAYSLLLESKGYKIQRNPNKQRKYIQHDLDIINAMITLNKTHGLTLETASEKVSSSDFNPSNVIEPNAEREKEKANVTALQTLPVADLTELHTALEFMAEHVATLERENQRLLKHVEALEYKQDKVLRVLEESNAEREIVATLTEQVEKLTTKLNELDQQEKQTKRSIWSKLFSK